MTQIVTYEEAKVLTAAEINQKIKNAFEYDDFRWQLENHLEINHPRRAEGLHALLYKCPDCQTESQMESKGTQLWCNYCGKKWEMHKISTGKE